MNPLNEKITLGKLLYLLLETRRFNNAKCTIWDDSKPIYVDKVGFIKDYITRGKLAEISNLQYLYNRDIINFHIKGFFKNKIEITISCQD